jgi:hypothetical protein
MRGGGGAPRKPLAVAILAALLTAGALTAAVAYVIRPSGGDIDAEVPATIAAFAPTGASPPADVAATSIPTALPSPTAPQSPTARRIVTPRIVSTFTPTPKSTRTPKPSPTPEPTVAALYLATGDDLAEWSGPNWRFENGLLVNDGGGIVSQPWLEAPYEAPNGGYAVESEIRVVGVASRHCEQSFGVVAGGNDGVVWGGGVIYACDGVRRARLTDVTAWSEGYNRHRQLDSATFDPGQDWHTYRLEVDGTHLRLLIDGQPVLEAEDDEATGEAQTGQVGLWSQGVGLEVRQVAVFAQDGTGE